MANEETLVHAFKSEVLVAAFFFLVVVASSPAGGLKRLRAHRTYAYRCVATFPCCPCMPALADLAGHGMPTRCARRSSDIGASQRERSQQDRSQGSESRRSGRGYHQPSDLGLAHYPVGQDRQVLVTGWSDLHTGAREPHVTSSRALSRPRAHSS